MMKLVLMGTGGFAVPSFEAIANCSEFEIVSVVTRPTVATTGKGPPPENPVRNWAASHSLPICEPDSINTIASIEQLKALQADLFVVCDYGQILSNEALSAARWGGINLHGSLLPRHRGAAPVQWSILRGDKVTGVSVIHMTPKLDGGPIVCDARTEIDTFETAEELEKRLSILGVDCTLKALIQLQQITTQNSNSNLDTLQWGVVQDASLITTAPRLKKQDGQLDCRYPVSIIDRQFRGLQPWPGMFGFMRNLKGQELRVIINQLYPIRIQAENTSATPSTDLLELSHTFPLGSLIWPERDENLSSLVQTFATSHNVDFANQIPLLIACNDGYLAVSRLQVAGKRSMDAKEFRTGYARPGNDPNSGMCFLTMPQPQSLPLLEKLYPLS